MLALLCMLLFLTTPTGALLLPGTSPLLPTPVLQLITPNGCADAAAEAMVACGAGGGLVQRIADALRSGVGLVQLRDYDSDPENILQLAKDLRRTVGSSGEGSGTSPALFVMNVHNAPLEFALDEAVNVDGVHLPERRIEDIQVVRSMWQKRLQQVDKAGDGGDEEGQEEGTRGKRFVVGVSVHSPEAASAAASLGADYVQVGTMFPTASHPGKTPEGPALMSAVTDRLRREGNGHVLVIGVGGITAGNCAEVLRCGGGGVAAISSLCAENAGQAARALMREMEMGHS